jgi:hypothetical protein
LPKGVTRVLQGCYKGVTRVLQGCYKEVRRVFKGFQKSASRVLEVFKGVQVRIDVQAGCAGAYRCASRVCRCV